MGWGQGIRPVPRLIGLIPLGVAVRDPGDRFS